MNKWVESKPTGQVNTRYIPKVWLLSGNPRPHCGESQLGDSRDTLGVLVQKWQMHALIWPMSHLICYIISQVLQIQSALSTTTWKFVVWTLKCIVARTSILQANLLSILKKMDNKNKHQIPRSVARTTKIRRAKPQVQRCNNPARWSKRRKGGRTGRTI